MWLMFVHIYIYIERNKNMTQKYNVPNFILDIHNKSHREIEMKSFTFNYII